jgi:Cdc6-like AAA superfamily ATPase
MSLFNHESCSILQDPRWLEPLSDPPGGKPLCRDAYLKLMARHLADLFSARQARNLFIHGPPGTGKTICVTHVLTEVAAHATETNTPIQTVYVNAGKTRNPYYTMQEIVKQLSINIPSAGWQMFRLKQALENSLAEKALLIAIDEVDSILYKEKEPLVYYLSRQPKTTLILISNDIDDVVRLPERALSTLQPVLIYMQPYTQEETAKILTERATHAYKPNTITDKLITTIAKAASDARDIRFGLRALITAASLADKAGKQTIDAGDVASAVEEENRVRNLRELETIRDKLVKLKKEFEKR